MTAINEAESQPGQRTFGQAVIGPTPQNLPSAETSLASKSSLKPPSVCVHLKDQADRSTTMRD